MRGEKPSNDTGEYCVKLDEKPYMLFRFTFTLDRAGQWIEASQCTRPITLHFGIQALPKRRIQILVPPGRAWTFTLPWTKCTSAWCSKKPGLTLNCGLGMRNSPPQLEGEEFHGQQLAQILRSPRSPTSSWRHCWRIRPLAMTPQQAKAAGVALPAVETDNTAFLANALARMGSSKRLAPGNKVILLSDFSFRNSQEVDFVSWRNGQKMICSQEGFSIWISLCRIDWVKTAQANNISVRTPTDLVYNGIESLAA